MLYDLSNDFDRKRFDARSESLKKNEKVVELTDRTRRTVVQNNYLHYALGYFAIEYGESLDYVKEHFFKRRWNPDTFVIKKRDRILGEVTILRSSSDISQEDMSTAISRFKHFSAKEAGINIPDAFTEEERRYLAVLIEKNRNYL